jgi:chaperonin GroES
MKPINDKIIVKPEPREEKSKGGLILKGITAAKYIEGDVLSVGHKVEDVKEGCSISRTQS